MRHHLLDGKVSYVPVDNVWTRTVNSIASRRDEDAMPEDMLYWLIGHRGRASTILLSLLIYLSARWNYIYVYISLKLRSPLIE